MVLRSSEHKGSASYESAIARASKFRGTDREGYRSEFIRLAELAASVSKLKTRIPVEHRH
jgi:Ca-activated chloride channel family protein